MSPSAVEVDRHNWAQVIAGSPTQRSASPPTSPRKRGASSYPPSASAIRRATATRPANAGVIRGKEAGRSFSYAIHAIIPARTAGFTSANDFARINSVIKREKSIRIWRAHSPSSVSL